MKFSNVPLNKFAWTMLILYDDEVEGYLHE